MTSLDWIICQNGWIKEKTLTQERDVEPKRYKGGALFAGLFQATVLYLAYLVISLADPWGYVPPIVQSIVYGLLFLLMMACILRGLRGKFGWSLKASLRAVILVLLLLVIAGILAGPESRRLIEIAIKPRGIFLYPVPEITLTVIPPVYSGRAKFTENLSLEPQPGPLLSMPASIPAPIPEGSEITVQLSNISHAPILIAGRQSVAFLSGTDGVFVARFILNDEISWTIKAGSRKIGTWPIVILEDDPPIIERADFRHIMTDDGLFSLSLHLRDDYGLAAAYVGVAPIGDGAAKNFQDRTALKLADLKMYEGEIYVNFSSSDLAGEKVDITLEAIDHAGQSQTETISGISLPAKKFTNPYAGEIIDIRRQLLSQPDQRKKLARQVMALGLVPDDGQTRPVYYMGLRSAYWRLTQPVNEGDVISARDILWDIAVTMEDGDAGEFNRAILDDLAALKLAIFQEKADGDIKQHLQDIDKTIVLFQRSQRSSLRIFPLTVRHEDKYNVKELRRIYGEILAHVYYKRFEQAIDLVAYLEHGFIYQSRDMFSAQRYERFQVINRARETVNILKKSQKQVLSYIYKQSITMEIANADVSGAAAAESQISLPNKDIEGWIAIQRKLAETVGELGKNLQKSGIGAAQITVAAGDLMRDVTRSMEAGDMTVTAQDQTEILMLLNSLKKILDREMQFSPD